ncbi:MAG TPA: hypothetical protein VEW71_00500 [Allosphingosinicella sp.]|nr:hypothetical protein [Allosphingosinicella sp.]
MTFEGFDAAPLIETAGFTPAVPGFAEPATPDAAKLDAALRVAARAERAAIRAEAAILDLWIDRSGGANLRALESGTSRHAWVLPAQGDSILDLSGAGAKDVLLFAAFGDDKSEEEDGAVVKGTRPKTVDDDSDWADFWGGGGGGAGDGGGDMGGGEPTLQPGEKPSCATSNEVTNKDAPDGVGKYYAPEGVNSAYLNAALVHIAGISANNPFNRFAVMQEIIDMYTDPNHPNFVDFKDWGSDRGPGGSTGVTWTYVSQATGAEVTGSLFEPFGNYFFGMLCTFGGLSPEEIAFAAAWFSESGKFWEGDDPQDIPHVQLGIADAKRHIDAQSPGIPNPPPIQVNEQCGG